MLKNWSFFLLPVLFFASRELFPMLSPETERADTKKRAQIAAICDGLKDFFKRVAPGADILISVDGFFERMPFVGGLFASRRRKSVIVILTLTCGTVLSACLNRSPEIGQKTVEGLREVVFQESRRVSRVEFYQALQSIYIGKGIDWIVDRGPEDYSCPISITVLTVQHFGTSRPQQ